MDVNELFLASRRGDLPRVEYLVEQKEVELNVRDKWDSTPLYYACLCGHCDLVKYLLQNGAKCEANTFDGERCLYGALNNEIRNILKSFKAITSSTMRRDVYSEFLRRLLERSVYDDVTFVVHGKTFQAHRCVLSCRSEYFAEMFRNKWKGRQLIQITHALVKPFAFETLLQYLYTGHMTTQIDEVDDIVRLANQCHIDHLSKTLMEKIKKVLSFESTKPGVNVTVLSIEPKMDSTDVQDDLGELAIQALPDTLCDQAGSILPFPPQQVDTYSDLIFCVQGHLFHCHKVFFCARSDYFKTLVEDHFGEISCSSSGHPIVTIHDTRPSVFMQVMNYVYADSCELDENNVYDVMHAGDMYLLPGLKRLCANFLSQLLDVESIMHTLRVARLFNLPRLEDQCAEFIASNIEKVCRVPEFAEFVREDAATLMSREETDSIPIIDDIRFHITNYVQTFSDMYEADEKLGCVDSFLEELDLDA